MLVLAAWVVLILSGNTGVEATTGNYRYIVRHYSSRDGLIQDQSFCILQDQKGYIWIGTFSGLSRYDGQNFKNYSLKDGLPGTYIEVLFEDRRGQIWAGTSRGAAQFVDERFQPRFFKNTNAQLPVFAIAESPDGKMYFGTSQGLIQCRGSDEKVFSQTEGLPKSLISVLFFQEDKGLWIGAEEGLFLLAQGRIVPCLKKANTEAKDEEIHAISLQQGSGALVVTWTHRLTILEPSGATTDLYPDSTKQAIFWDAVVDRHGTLWISSDKGVYFRENGQPFQLLTRASGLFNNSTYQLMLDYEDNLWICSQSGLDRLSDRSVVLYPTADSEKLNTVWCIVPIGGKLLVGLESGFRFFSDGVLDSRLYLPGLTVIDAYPQKDGRILLCTNMGLYSYENDPAKSTRIKELPESVIYSILPLSDGSILVGTDNGLCQSKLSNFRSIPLGPSENRVVVYEILPVALDTIWLGTNTGVRVLEKKPEGWGVSPDVFLKGIEVQCLARHQNGDIYLGTLGLGLYLSRGGGKPEPVNLPILRSDSNIWDLYYDQEQRLWIGTSHGIRSYHKGRIEDFGAVHGLPNDEITSKRSIYTDKAGNYYFGTDLGLLRFRPSSTSTSPVPRLCVEKVLVNQKPAPLGQAIHELNYRDSLSIYFRCLSFINENANRYQYMLEGFEEDWRDLTPENHIFYPYLAPGDYKFHLRTFNSRRVSSELAEPIVIRVNPPFTQTLWFVLLVAAGVIGVVWAFIAYKVYLDKKEKEKLRQLVSIKHNELLGSEEKYRRLVEASLVGIAIIRDDKVVFVNPIFPRMLHYVPGDIVGADFEQFLHPDDRPLLREYQELRRKGDLTPHEYEIRVFCGDGTIRNLLLQANVTLYNNEPAILINVIDITEKKRLQEQLIHYQKLESIGTLAGGIAHDFNNIMQGITGLTSLVRMQLPDDSPTQADLAMIEEATTKATTLTRKLLGFARKGKYVVAQLEIREVIDSVIAFSRRTIPLNIEFACHFQSDPLYTRGDRNQMEQVFLNLFLNSRDAMPEGGVITVTTDQVVFQDDVDKGNHVLLKGRYILIKVEDTGIGIPAEVLPKVFDPFFSTKPQEKGSGLGLATVYGIVKNHYGYIYFDSIVGEGTCVTIYLPFMAKPEPSPPLPVRHPEVPSAGQSLQGKVVLIVEDEEINRQFLRKLIQMAGMDVLEAENGLQAIQLFRSTHREINLVLLDVNMPVMDGRETLEELRKIAPHIPVVVLSGYGEDAKIQQMMEIGCQDFIQKPIDAHVLVDKIKSILGNEVAPSSPQIEKDHGST